MSLLPANARAALDAGLASTNQIEWSANGSSVSGSLAATTVSLEAATDLTTYQRKGITVASPPLLTAGASASVTITHWRFSQSGTGKTAWNALSSPAVLVAGGQISLANAALYEKITAA